MEFCGMKREIDRKCLNHARVHANAQSFDRCEADACILVMACADCARACTYTVSRSCEPSDTWFAVYRTCNETVTRSK